MSDRNDLEGLKRFAKTLLKLDIQKTEMSPLVVKHPFTDSGVVGIRQEDGHYAIGNLIDNEDDMKAWSKQTEELIDQAETPFHVFMMITKSYMLGFLKYAKPFLSGEDFTKMLADAWVRSESPNADPNLSKTKLVSLFKAADPEILMDAEERERLQSLDNPVTIYRGVTSYNARNVKALSWTLDENVARWFASRFGEQGRVYQAQIAKDDILAIFTGRNESEVIVDPKQLREIKLAQELQMDLSM